MYYFWLGREAEELNDTPTLSELIAQWYARRMGCNAVS